MLVCCGHKTNFLSNYSEWVMSLHSSRFMYDLTSTELVGGACGTSEQSHEMSYLQCTMKKLTLPSSSWKGHHYTEVDLCVRVCMRACVRAGGDRKPFNPRQRSLFFSASVDLDIKIGSPLTRLAMAPAASKGRWGRIRLKSTLT